MSGRAACLAVALAGIASGGCNKPGSALVHLEIEAVSVVAGMVDQVEASVSQSEPQPGAPPPSPLNRQVVAWKPGPSGKMAIGLYIPPSASSPVWASARGLRAGAAIAAAGPERVSIRAGELSALTALVLRPGSAPVGGQGGSGGAGGVGGAGGAAGGSGGGGGGGGTSGTPVPEPARDGAAPGDRPPADGGAPDGRGAWSPPEKIENDPLDPAYETSVAVDPIKGDALVVIVERQMRVKALRFDATGRRWAAPVSVGTGARLGHAVVAMDTTRGAYLVWTERATGAAAGVWESRSTDGGATWSAPAKIHTGTACINTHLAAARNGRARVAWEESVGSYNIMRTSYFDGTRWSPAAMPLDSNDFFSERRPRVLMDPAGAGFVVWMQPEPMSPRASAHAYAARFTAAPLDPPAVLDIHPGSVNHPVAAALAPDGRSAVVAWKQNYEGGGTDLLAVTWSTGGAWTMPARAAAAGPTTSNRGAAAVIDSTGAATLVYETVLNTATRNLVAVRREPGRDWATPVPLETDNSSPGASISDGDYLFPAATVDGRGQVQVAWRKRHAPGAYGLSARRLSPAAATWDPEVKVAMRDRVTASQPTLATTDDGRTILTWVYLDPPGMAMDPDVYNVHVSFSPP